ncbi:MAG: MgtC/SapB family protein [Candidatus Margulisiibacteriota bacterium]|nr:MgtC/SapB family protein [Candidatus Margulisiibacteriota bacterium]
MFNLGWEADVILKLILACVFGGMIGVLREQEKKAAGLRTHMLVCMGAALFVVISLFIESKYIGVDVGRIASNVVIGIGFIGAGTIIQSREGSVIGITTAASIWVTAAIGVALGFGMYITALTAMVLAVIALKFLGHIEKRFFK